MVCSNCKKKNKSTNIRCEFCGHELISSDDFDTLKKDEITLQQKIVFLTFIFISIGMILYGIISTCYSVYSWILENNTKKNYDNTEALFVDFRGCYIDEDGNELCNAVYEYTVNNEQYTVLLDLEVIKDVYEERQIVYYDSKNPSKSVIYSGDERIIVRIIGVVFGFIMMFSGIFIMLFDIAVYKMLKNPKKVIL